MSFDIVLTAEATEDVKVLRAHLRAEVRDAMETHLRHAPRKASRSRIKPLRGLRQPQYQLRAETFGCSTTLSTGPSRSWQSSRNRRPTHG